MKIKSWLCDRVPDYMKTADFGEPMPHRFDKRQQPPIEDIGKTALRADSSDAASWTPKPELPENP